MSVGRFPFHRGRGETEVARNLLRRALPFRPAVRWKETRVALENEEQDWPCLPKGSAEKRVRGIEKGGCGIINQSLSPFNKSFFHQIYRRTVYIFCVNWNSVHISSSYLFIYFRKLAREVQRKRNDVMDSQETNTKEVIIQRGLNIK